MAYLALLGCAPAGVDGSGGPASDGGPGPDGSVGSGGAAGAGGGGGGWSAPARPSRYPADRVRSPISASVAERLRAIAEADPGRAGDVFMKAGASGTVSTHLLYCFAGEAQPGYLLDLDGRDALLPAIARFRGGDAAGATPFDRATLAAKIGVSASWVLAGDPSPLQQEMDALDPRYAFINYGTNDMELGVTHASALWPFFENLSAALDVLEGAGVVPIVSGLNPRSDSAAAAQWVPTYDAVTRALAEARQIPYLSLYLLSKDLPDQGLVADGVHGNAYFAGGSAQPCVMTAEALAFNYNARNLASLEILDVVERIVGQGEPAPDPPPSDIAGDGSAEDPFVIDALPFSHAADTSVLGSRAIATYAGCGAPQDESGPELYYRLELSQPTPLRAMVFDRAGTDVDIHLLATPSGEACLARDDRMIQGTFGPGALTFALDTFVASGAELSGPYVLVVLACDAEDPDCQ